MDRTETFLKDLVEAHGTSGFESEVYGVMARHLKGSGMGYRAIANEVRFEIARQLLEDTEVPLGQIAAALRYSEASAFTRAFRRWSGQTPTAWRADGRQEDGLAASM